jgi:hypothetical protein
MPKNKSQLRLQAVSGQWQAALRQTGRGRVSVALPRIADTTSESMPWRLGADQLAAFIQQPVDVRGSGWPTLCLADHAANRQQ